MTGPPFRIGFRGGVGRGMKKAARKQAAFRPLIGGVQAYMLRAISIFMISFDPP